MNKLTALLPTVSRVLLGLVFAVFGLNGFLQFLPMPPMEGAAGAFVGALVASGYLFPLMKGVEVLAGLLLLANRYVPLALTLLAPIIVNIALFHFVLTPSEVGMAVLLLAAEIYLAWSYRGAFRGVLEAKARPTISEESPVIPSATATAR